MGRCLLPIRRRRPTRSNPEVFLLLKIAVLVVSIESGPVHLSGSVIKSVVERRSAIVIICSVASRLSRRALRSRVRGLKCRDNFV